MNTSFGYQFIIDQISELAPGIFEVVGQCFDGIRKFAVNGNYKVGDKIFVLGNFVFDDFVVVKEGLVK